MSGKQGGKTDEELFAEEMREDGQEPIEGGGDAPEGEDRPAEDTEDDTPVASGRDAAAPAKDEGDEAHDGRLDRDRDEQGRYVPKTKAQAKAAKVGKEPAQAKPDLSALPEGLQSAWQARENELQRLERDRKGLAGRVPQLQHEVSELRQQLARLQQQGTAPAPGNGSGGQKDQQASDVDVKLPEALSSADYQSFKSDFPDFAKVFEATVRELESRREQDRRQFGELRDRLPQVLDQRLESIESASVRTARDALTVRHPDWRDHCMVNPDGQFTHNSPEFARFWWTEGAQKFREEPNWRDVGYCTALMDSFKDYLAEQDGAASAASAASSAAQRAAGRTNGLRAASAPVIRGRTASPGRLDTSRMTDEELFIHEMRED